MGAGGLKIEPKAACSRELILHAVPVSNTPAARQPAKAGRQTLLPCAGHLRPDTQCALYNRHQVKSGHAPPIDSTHSTVAGGETGLQGGGGSRWKTIGDMGCVWETKACFIFYQPILLPFPGLDISLSSEHSQDGFSLSLFVRSFQAFLGAAQHPIGFRSLERRMDRLLELRETQTAWKNKGSNERGGSHQRGTQVGENEMEEKVNVLRAQDI